MLSENGMSVSPGLPPQSGKLVTLQATRQDRHLPAHSHSRHVPSQGNASQSHTTYIQTDFFK